MRVAPLSVVALPALIRTATSCGRVLDQTSTVPLAVAALPAVIECVSTMKSPSCQVEVGHRPVLKIVDFGGAGAVSDKGGDAPVLRVLVPDYAAPELVDKHLGAIGTWTDVFSLAVIVLECLAGTLATRNVAASVIVDPKHRPSAKKLGLDLPKRVDDVLERALASEPSRRPKNVAAFWRELKAAAAAPI